MILLFCFAAVFIAALTPQGQIRFSLLFVFVSINKSICQERDGLRLLKTNFVPSFLNWPDEPNCSVPLSGAVCVDDHIVRLYVYAICSFY